MKIVVKPKNIYNLNKMKANAFIFGMKDFSVNATLSIDIKTLASLVKKLKDKEIFVSIDKNIFDKDIEKLKQLLIELDKLNISGILFYDIALLTLKEELKLKIPLIWNQNFFVTNYETIKFYKNIGVNKMVISSVITKDEIKEIAKNIKADLFVSGFGYQLMAYSKRKLVTNYFKHIKTKNISNKHYLKDKDGIYKIEEEKIGTAIISSNILNAIKEVNTFKTIGIKYIILDEKNIKRNDFIYVLNIFFEVINKKVNKTDLEKYEKQINSKFKNIDTGFLYKKTIYKVK